ncbi:MAG: N-acetylmuramoyl-L-alanine amidase [Clostridium sp.]|nr:N-acetylmuramoyl-L-alanine amidase [Clostridium sp.]
MNITKMYLNCNYTKGRYYSDKTWNVDTITIHHMAGNLSLQQCYELFNNPSRRASSNYAIDSAGNVACYVPDEYASWCSSSTANDVRAITIELANDGGEPNWHVSTAALTSCVQLCYELCKKHGISSLIWRDEKGAVPPRQNLTTHDMFKNKVCPGRYVRVNLPFIARDVNEALNVAPRKENPFYYTLYLEAQTGISREHLVWAIRETGLTTLRETYEYGEQKFSVGRWRTEEPALRVADKIKAECKGITPVLRLCHLIAPR